MALNAQVPLAAEPGMVLEFGPLAGVTTDAGHCLAGSGIENIFPDRMGENSVLPMAFAADFVDGRLGHRRMVGAVGRMAVVAGTGPLVLEFGGIVPLESRLMAITANVALFPLEQPRVITGVRRMAGHAAIVAVPHQVIVG